MSRAIRAAAALALLALALPAAAQLYDPAFRWRTLDTPRFRVHYHQGEEELAQEVARAAERAHAVLSPVLGYAPRQRTEIVLSDDTDDANGSATPIPYDTIRLYAVPPPSLSELNDYRDWVTSLVFHEYVHILHLDHVGGIPAFANAIFGKLFVPNGLVPAWMVEGIAVAHEGDGEAPGSGRNASALEDMEARALATEGPFPRLDQVSNPFLEWPLGGAPYLLGGRFMRWLEGRYGQPAVAGYLGDQGSQVWPYAPSWVGERWFGKDFPALWAEYAEAERARFAGQLGWIRSRPVTRPVRLTRKGGQVERPRWSPDGRFVAFFRRDLDRAPGIFRVTAAGEELGRGATIEGNGALALRSPREAVVAVSEVWHEHRVYDDLWLVDLEGGPRRRLTDGARASDPDLGPGGALAYVRHTGGGTTALVRRPLEGGDEEVLFARRGAEVYSPAVSPDGGRVAFELQEGGRRDIALWEAGRVTRVTDDDALDLGPAWTPDGRFLLFAADRGGVFDLYAWEAATGALRQVTNVESGAFQPAVSPDGRTIAFVGYSRAGFDVETIPFDPASWLEPTPARPPPSGSGTPPAPAEPLASRPYRALDTLGPTFWLPVYGSDGAGSIYGALTAGGDVLGRHAWGVQAWWSAGAQELGYAASYVGGWSWPTFDLSSSRFVDSAPGGPRGLERVSTPLDAGATLTVTRLARALALRLGWSGTQYDVLGVSGKGPTSDWIGYRDGFLSQLSLQAVYSDARRFVRSISPEEGGTLSLRLLAAVPELGSDFSVARAAATGTRYLRLPGTDHDVLALRLAGGVANGSIGGRAPFRLGGTYPADALALVLGTATAPADTLRGYPSGWLRGTGYGLASAEVRFPLFAPTRGYSTWPVFLRRVHAALAADLGDAFDLPGELPFAGHPFSTRDLRLGAAAELRLEVVLGYYVRTDVRLGIAHAFGPVFRGATREPGVGAAQGYLTLGESF